MSLQGQSGSPSSGNRTGLIPVNAINFKILWSHTGIQQSNPMWHIFYLLEQYVNIFIIYWSSSVTKHVCIIKASCNMLLTSRNKPFNMLYVTFTYSASCCWKQKLKHGLNHAKNDPCILQLFMNHLWCWRENGHWILAVWFWVSLFHQEKETVRRLLRIFMLICNFHAFLSATLLSILLTRFWLLVLNNETRAWGTVGFLMLLCPKTLPSSKHLGKK